MAENNDANFTEGKSPKKQRVHIISEDGICANTQLLNGDTEQPLGIRAYRVELTVDARDEQKLWKAALYTYFPYLDILADAEVFQKCRYCKHDLVDGWEGQDTMLANQVKFFQEMREERKKPLRDALDFHHGIEQVLGIPQEYGLTIIEKYEQAIREFLGEKKDDDEGAKG